MRRFRTTAVSLVDKLVKRMTVTCSYWRFKVEAQGLRIDIIDWKRNIKMDLQ